MPRVVIEYYYVEHGASPFAFPQFHHKEVVEYSDPEGLHKYLTSQEDEHGCRFRKNDPHKSSGFHYTSQQGGIKIKPYKPPKIKRI